MAHPIILGDHSYVEPISSMDFMRGVPVTSYRGAMRTRTSTLWDSSTSYRGGRSSDRRDLREMCSRGRRVYRENTIGRSLLDTETDNVVAEGYRLHMQTNSPEFNREAPERFAAWLDRADITGLMGGTELMRASWREPRKDGDGGILLINNGGVPRLQYVPGDLITNPYKGFDVRSMFDGVEIDAVGRPTRFHIREVDEGGKDTITAVDARDFVYMAHRNGEPNALRGATVYEPIFALLDQVDAYLDAVIVAARMGAIFGLIMKKNKPQAVLDKLAQMANSQGNWQRGMTLENGLLQIIGTDEDVAQVQAHQPMQQTPDFLRACFRIACLAFDMPLEIGQKDLSQVNFSGGRIGLIGYYRSCRVKQAWHQLPWKRIVFWWLSIEKKRQALGFDNAFTTPFPEDYGQFSLQGREWDYNDPLKEAEADLMEISMGLASPQQKAKERGKDFEQLMRELAEARRMMMAAGLPLILSTHVNQEDAAAQGADTDPAPTTEPADAPLNGTQIAAALDVMKLLREGALTEPAAVEFVTKLGIDAVKAQQMARELPKLDAGAGDVAWKREVLKGLLAVPQAREAVYNAIDVLDLAEKTGLKRESGYVPPYAAVVAPAGQLNTGATIRDPEGDIVGADVINEEPVDAPVDGGGTRNTNPSEQQANQPAE